MKPKAKNKQSKKATVKLSIEHLATFPFPCLNCGQSVRKAKLYCSELCAQEASFVRYVRGCYRDGRDQQPDVQAAIQIKLAMILGGGYPEQERQLPKSVREAVFKRDKGRCQKCGQPGDQIDHICGSSNDMNNLQLLCRACHNQKTKDSFVRITAESHPKEWAKVKNLYCRIETTEPIQPCDGEDWENIWRQILSERRQVIKGVDEYASPNPVLVYAEAEGFYDPEDMGEMSDGEQAEYFALIEGGGDEAWAADMFGFDHSDYHQRPKSLRTKPSRKLPTKSRRSKKVLSSAKKKQK